MIVVRQWLDARSPRERRLLLAMLAIAVPVLMWLVVIMPVSRAYEAALANQLEAIDRNGRIRLLAEGPRTNDRERPSGDLAVIVSESAAQAGLTLDSSDSSGPHSLRVAIAQGAPTTVTQWLSGLEARGMSIQDLRITPSGLGSVSMSANIVRDDR